MNTKKQLRLLLISAVVLAVLVAAYFIVRHAADKYEEAENAGDGTLIDWTADVIAEITFTGSDDEELTLTRTDGTWYLQGEDDFEVDQDAAGTVAAGMTGVTINQTITDPGDAADYGLDEPANTITVTDTSGNVITVYVGTTNSVTGDLYVQKEGDGNVYAVPSTFASAVSVSKEDLKASEESSDVSAEE